MGNPHQATIDLMHKCLMDRSVATSWNSERESIEEAFTLTSRDKQVIDAFIDQKPATSKKLDTDGKKLSMSGKNGFVYWKDSKIHTKGAFPSVKTDETILRYLKKEVPKNWWDDSVKQWMF